MLRGFWLDGHWIPVEVDPNAKWIEIKHPEPCPDCESARRKLFGRFIREQLRAAGQKAYEDGRADSEDNPT